MAGILVLTLIGYGIYRGVRAKKGISGGVEKKVAGRERALRSPPSAAIIATAMKNVHKVPSLANVLVKNRYSEIGFSLIPVLLAAQGGLLIVSAPFVFRKPLRNARLEKLVAPKQSVLTAREFREIERFLSEFLPAQSIRRIVPFIGVRPDQAKVQEATWVPLESLGDFAAAGLDSQSEDDADRLAKVFERISDANLFGKSRRARGV